MSTNGDLRSQIGFDPNDHQTSYVFAPVTGDGETNRPKKRRKISTGHAEDVGISEGNLFKFAPLFNGAESPAFIEAREKLFKDSWAATESRVQSILEAANDKTLDEVISFVKEDVTEEHRNQIPTALIVTGPNVASQELLFSQISSRLKSMTDCLVITLRSMDASNLKAVLKKLIRVATNQKGDEEDELHVAAGQTGRKLLNYDLRILQDHLASSSFGRVAIAFQDSEAFDNGLLAELVLLLRSWLDRIPFVMLFGIATSTELFHERLPASVIRCLHGAQFHVEQTIKTLEKVFQEVVAGTTRNNQSGIASTKPNAALLLGPAFITSILDRQHDHVQSLQTFIGALKYAYMCHFYANPLSVLLANFCSPGPEQQTLQGEHFEAIRMLPSFRRMIEQLLVDGEITQARLLLDSNSALEEKIYVTLGQSREAINTLFKNIELLATTATFTKHNVDQTDLYVKAFAGNLGKSNITESVLISIHRMSPSEFMSFTQEVSVRAFGQDGHQWEVELSNEDRATYDALMRIQSETFALIKEAEDRGTVLRGKHAAQSKILRTTVVAQKVQLSKEKSTLSNLDVSYAELVDELIELLGMYFEFADPQTMFLHEIWLYDMKSPNRESFIPKPRYSIERALSSPHDYLSCTCCRPTEEGLSASQPPTAIVYQLYLETGGLINVYDLWSAFYTIIGGDESEDCDERTALVLFYRALSDLKLLGMVKQSRKKTDHLAKLAWKGL